MYSKDECIELRCHEDKGAKGQHDPFHGNVLRKRLITVLIWTQKAHALRSIFDATGIIMGIIDPSNCTEEGCDVLSESFEQSIKHQHVDAPQIS